MAGGLARRAGRAGRHRVRAGGCGVPLPGAVPVDRAVGGGQPRGLHLVADPVRLARRARVLVPAGRGQVAGVLLQAGRPGLAGHRDDHRLGPAGCCPAAVATAAGSTVTASWMLRPSSRDRACVMSARSLVSSCSLTNSFGVAMSAVFSTSPSGLRQSQPGPLVGLDVQVGKLVERPGPDLRQVRLTHLWSPRAPTMRSTVLSTSCARRAITQCARGSVWRVRSPRSLMRVPVCKRAGCPQPRGRAGCTLGKRPFPAPP